MKAKRTISIFMIAILLLSFMTMTAGAATTVTELIGHIEFERDDDRPGYEIDIELLNDDLFDEEEIFSVSTIGTQVGGSEHITNRYEFILIPERNVDLSALTLKNVRIDGAVVTEIEPLNRRGGIVITFDVIYTDHGLPFIDIGKKDWYFESVKYVYEHQLMNGIKTHKFSPKNSTTREQLVTVLWRMNGAPTTKGRLPFTDVKKSSYAKSAIIWAAENGIVKGVSDTAFAPGRAITREQLVTLFYRYTEFLGGTPASDINVLGDYRDMREISAYARNAMAWAIENNVVTGMTASTLAPRGTATRAQIATILMRYERLTATPVYLELVPTQPATLFSAIYLEK